MPGTPPDFIQPNWLLRIPKSVKPMHAGTEVNDGTFEERAEDKMNYSINDLAYIVDNLATHHGRFFDYLKENGLMHM